MSLPETTFRSLTNQIPEKVKSEIFARLDLKSRKSARHVCHRWRVLVDKTLSFRVELTDFTHSYVANFGRSRPVSELLVGFLSIPYPPEGWNLSVRSLSILADYRFEVCYKTNELKDHYGREIALSNHIPHHQPSLAMVVMSETKLQRLFNEFKNIRKLTLSSLALADIKSSSFLRDNPLNFIRELDIAQDFDHGIEAIEDLLLNTFESLHSLSLSINSDNDLMLYSEMYAFIGRHKSITSLKRDFLRGSLVHHSDPTINNDEESEKHIISMNKDHKLGPVTYAKLLKELASVRLRHLELHILATEGMMRKNFELKLLQVQDGLTTLHLSNLRPENMPVWRTLPLVISTCSRTLRSLTLDGCFCRCSSQNPPGPFPGSWVRECRRLETLECLVCGVKVVGLIQIPSKVKKLCLGHLLTSKQIKIILETFRYLEQLSLPQAQIQSLGLQQSEASENYTMSNSKWISLMHFKSALQLPSLHKLVLSSRTCKYKPIRKYASSLIGVVENNLYGKQGASKRGDVEYLIDRNVFTFETDETESDYC